MLQALLIGSLALAVFCAVCVVVNLRRLPRLSREGRAAADARAAGDWPRVSIVIPARDEERDVEAAVRGHLAQDYPHFEVVVVDDRSTDRTGEILRRLASEDPRLRVIAGREPPPGWLGKPHALHLGAQAATGDPLLFVDADVRWAPGGLRAAVAFLDREKADFLVVLPHLESRGFWENVLMPNLSCTFYFGPAFLMNMDRAPWLAAGGGAGNLVRRAPYEAIGGHEALRASVVDDVNLAMTIKRAGYRHRAIRAEDSVAVRMYRGFREVFDGFTKNTAFVFQGPVTLTLLAAGIVATGIAAILPPLVLLAAALGASVTPVNLALAAASTLLAIGLRVVVARAVGDPLWPAPTHAFMAAIWTGIIARSLFRRFVLRRVVWRGRHYDAGSARF
jgi:chlorobactene glucosyltransferase